MSDDEGPKVFGDYYLLTRLAQGGMGSIHLAKRVGFRSDIQRFLVVKKLPRGHANARDLRRFQDEARIVVTLNHRALCHVFDVGIVNDEHYLAMELVEGVTLHHAMSSMKLEPALALYVIDEMLDALDYVHQHKDPATGVALQIVHRDVSPHNVMLSFQGAVKLIDFGLVSSTLKQEHTAGGVVVGKLEYMSPEQSRSEPLDARSDVYAAAVISYELLTGRRFYAGLSKGALMTAVVEGGYLPSFEGIDPALVGPLQRALAGEREARTASCAAFQSELARAAPRASSRDLREALRRGAPEEQARLEALVRSFRDVGVDAPAREPETKITHIARSDEETRLLRSRGGPDLSEEPTLIGAPTAEATVTTPTAPPRRRRALSAAVAVAALSGAAALAVWILVRAPAQHEDIARTTTNAALDAGAVDVGTVGVGVGAADVGGVDAGATERAALDAGVVSRAGDGGVVVVNEGGDDDSAANDGSASASSPRAHKPRRVRPPNTALPDLAAHLDYLARWCTRTPCSRSVLAARGRIPVLDVVGLRALRHDAEACVLECRR